MRRLEIGLVVVALFSLWVASLLYVEQTAAAKNMKTGIQIGKFATQMQFGQAMTNVKLKAAAEGKEGPMYLCYLNELAKNNKLKPFLFENGYR